jgi:archaetidylinositol phosphate synthase
MPEDFTHLS